MKTEIICILDCSTSMQKNQVEAIDGFNSFLSEQQDTSGEARLTTVTFADTLRSPLYEGQDIQQINPITPYQYHCYGWTALFDAIGDTVTRQEARIKREGWADKVALVILTDGLENRSKRWDVNTIRELLMQKQERDGWSVVFLAANQDAVLKAKEYGMDTQYASTYDDRVKGGTVAAYAVASQSLRSIRGTGPC